MRAFEERFVLLQIPYSVVGGPRFFERAEIRDAHAYLRLVQSPDDDLAFERIVNMPRRGIGDATVKKLLQIGRGRGVSASVAAADLVRTDELTGRSRTALATFLRDMDRWRGLAIAHPRLAETILEESGYIDLLRLDKGPTSQTRLENLKELVQSMGAFDTLEAYLEHVSLVTDLDREAGDDAVQIMTLHSAKGLEFPLVFLPGWEEGVFPSQRSLDESGEKGLEEERRLAYVGLTRAKEVARISFAANRQVYGRWTSQLPSRFVDELPLASVEAVSETGYYGGGLREGASRWDEVNYGAGYDSPGWRRAQARGYAGGPPGRTQVIEGEGRLVAVSDLGAPGAYAAGDRVFHQKFGPGVVTQVEGNKLTVAFDHAGEKRVIDSFVTRG
jgi:DNA helicase-2/ATP-dependent DNA helicase PcrA